MEDITDEDIDQSPMLTRIMARFRARLEERLLKELVMGNHTIAISTIGPVGVVDGVIKRTVADLKKHGHTVTHASGGHHDEYTDATAYEEANASHDE